MVTTIGGYSVSLGLNASGLIDGSKLARGELRSLQSTVKSLETPQEKITRQLNLLDKAYQQGAISARHYAEATKRINENAAGAAGGNILGGAGSLLKIGGALGAIAGAALLAKKGLDALDEPFKKFAEMEKALAKFDVLTGSAKDAAKMTADITQLSSQGISKDALTQSAAMMLSFNVAAKDVIPTLRSIGEIVGGDSESIKRMSRAFAQVSTIGHLMAEELNQMRDAGFNPLMIIAAKTGEKMDALTKRMAAGKVSFDEVRDAFISATSEGGKFYGMLDKINSTPAGSINKTAAAWEKTGLAIGEAAAPLKQLQNFVSQDFAKDFEHIAKMLTFSKPPPVEEVVDPVKQRADRLAATIEKQKKQQEEFAKATAEEAKKQQDLADAALPNLQKSAIKGSVDDETFAKFERAISMLTKAKQEMAIEDFAEYKNLDGIYGYLEDNVEAELRRLDAIEAQNKAIEKQKQDREKLKDQAERLVQTLETPAEKLAKQFAEIQALQEQQLLSADQAFALKDKLASDQVKDITIEAPRSLDVGGQGAADFMARIQNDQLSETAKANAKRATEAAAQLAATNLTNKKLDKLAETQPRNKR